MTGLGTRPVKYLGLALFESQRIYAPQSIARRIVNLDREPDGTLLSIESMGRYDPKSTTTLDGPILGLAHLETLDGANQVTVLRAGTKLYRHQGWTRTFATLTTGLTYDPNQAFPDVCLPIAGYIVWSNGVDRPLIIDCAKDYGRRALPLGFDNVPAAPLALSPTPGIPALDGSNTGGSGYGAGAGNYPPNQGGYSVPGNIGTVSQFNGEDGALLDSTHIYRVQWEDCYGNLSPLSYPSNLATIAAQSTGYWGTLSTNYVRKNNLDMLRRGFCVRGIDKGESHVKAIRVYRTTDTAHSAGEYHLLTRIEGRQAFAYPDSRSDAVLVNGDTPQKPVPVLPFRVACEYQGRLVACNFPGSPGLVRWSQPGFIGTFLEDDWIVPDASGAQVTGAVSYNGAVYLFTEMSIFQLNIDAEGPRLQPVSSSVGTLAPASAQCLPDGRIAFLSRLGMFAIDHKGQIEEIGTEVTDILERIQTGAGGRSVAAIDPATGIYVLALPTNSAKNDTMLGYDFRVGGWRSYDALPFRPVTLHAASGRAGHLLVGATLPGSLYSLRVWNHPDVSGTNPFASSFESNELRLDPQGLKVFRCRGILVGFIESDVAPSDPGCTVRVWTTSRRTRGTPAESYYDTSMELVGQDFLDAWALGGVTLNASEAYFRTPMVTWRVIPIDVSMITGLRFKISVSAGRRLHLHGFSVIAEEQGQEASRVSGPVRGV